MSLTNFIKSSFNRTPETGDQFLAIVTYAEQSYLCGMTVTSVGSTNVSATVGTVTALQGGGSTPTLYRHIVHFSQTAAASGATVIYSRRSTVYTLDALNDDLKEFGCTTPSTYYSANGTYSGGGMQGTIFGIFANGSNVACQHTNGTATLNDISDIVSQVE